MQAVTHDWHINIFSITEVYISYQAGCYGYIVLLSLVCTCIHNQCNETKFSKKKTADNL